jgi:hypothetical protein
MGTVQYRNFYMNHWIIAPDRVIFRQRRLFIVCCGKCAVHITACRGPCSRAVILSWIAYFAALGQTEGAVSEITKIWYILHCIFAKSRHCVVDKNLNCRICRVYNSVAEFIDSVRVLVVIAGERAKNIKTGGLKKC